MEKIQIYLQATRSIQSEDGRIVELTEQIRQGVSNPNQVAQRLFVYVRDQIKYNPYSPFFLEQHYHATNILERGSGYCVQKAIVLTTLARACQIPSRLIFADIRNYRSPQEFQNLMGTNLFVYHCYVEMYLGDRWLQMTPAFDQRISKKHDFPLVEFDGNENAIFPPQDARGRKFVEYVQHHGVFADLPLERILKAWEEAYGKERVETWKKSFGNQERDTHE